MHRKVFILIFVCFLVERPGLVDGATNFTEYFKDCKLNSSNFNNCMIDSLNDVRIFFKTGVPEMNIPPFDPFFAEEVLQSRGGQMFNYKLKLKNVTESGWSISKVTKFKMDLSKNLIQYTQSFPDKNLKGSYEIVGKIFGREIANKGKWSLRLIDFVQTTTISRKPSKISNDVNARTPLKVNVNVQTVRNMELHITNLLGGATILENIADVLINTAWPPGFALTKPLVNDLVSTAFTKIFNDAFENFPLEELFR